LNLETEKIAVIGFGYVGLPLAVEFGKKRPVVGYDIRQSRVEELKAGCDSTREVEPAELREARLLGLENRSRSLPNVEKQFNLENHPYDMKSGRCV